jgi:hypothetical protein
MADNNLDFKVKNGIVASSAVISSSTLTISGSQVATQNYANSASLNAYNNASAFAVTTANSASLNAYNLGVTYTNSASLNAYSNASAFAVTQSNSASLNSYNNASAFAVTYANSASSNGYNSASSFAQLYSNSSSLNSYNQASAFAINANQNYYASAQNYTSGSAWNNTNASVGYASNSASLGGIQAADYALETSSNTFVGTQAILTGASANKGLIVQGSSLQTANLQEWQNSSSTALVGVTASGYIYSGSLLFASTATQGSAAHLSIYAASSNPSIILRPAVTADPNSNHVEIYNTPTATSPTLSINKSGQLSSTGITGQSSGVGFPITAVRSLPNNGVLGLAARQSSSGTHTSDLLQIQQATTYLSFAGITASGQIYTGINTASGYTTVPLTNTSGSYAQLSVSPASSSNPGVIIKAKASQTANLQEWQNSSGSTLSYVNSNGQFIGDGSLLTGTGIPIYYSLSASTASFSPTAASSFPLLGLSTGSVALAANTIYKIDMEFAMQSVSSAVTRTASLQFLSTSSFSSLGYSVEVLATTSLPPTSATATSNINIISSSALLAIETARSAAGTLSRIVRVRGTLRTGTASTALSPLMQFSSNPETNITFLQGSYMSFIPLLGSTSNGTWG